MSEPLPTGGPTRQVVHGDALEWLAAHPSMPDTSVVASLPDVSELGVTMERWRAFFTEAVRLALLTTAPDGLTVFFQTDLRLEGRWVSKAGLVLGAAAALDVPVLWHKIVCRRPPGTRLTGRPGYSHLIAFSRQARMPGNRDTADVLPDLGDMPWSHSMGTASAREALHAIRLASPTTTTVVAPFCGVGTVLALANEQGFHAIGIERNRKRAEQARHLVRDGAGG